jgi:hypothetical protein
LPRHFFPDFGGVPVRELLVAILAAVLMAAAAWLL